MIPTADDIAAVRANLREGRAVLCGETISLVHVDGYWIASDCEDYRDGDAVYSPATESSRAFVAGLPGSRCERLLDVGTGSGVAALIGARTAAHVWAVDVNARAIAFAGVNARLNNVTNITLLQGDLFDPVAGIRFDRIVAHPPYLAVTDRASPVCIDGGPDGEHVIRRLVAGLPAALATGGRFHGTFMATDRKGAPLEHRLRSMLGTREAEHDVVVVEHHAVSPRELADRRAAAGRIGAADAERMVRRFAELDVERVVFCWVVIAHHAAPGRPQTLRRRLAML